MHRRRSETGVDRAAAVRAALYCLDQLAPLPSPSGNQHTAAAGGKRTHASQQENSIRYFVGASEQQGRQLRAELPVQFFGSRQTQIPLYSGFLAPTFAKHAFPGRGIYGAITVAQDLLANFSDQSANEQSYLPLNSLTMCAR